MNSQRHDSEKEWGLKQEEVSLGSRIVNTICYHSHGKSEKGGIGRSSAAAVDSYSWMEQSREWEIKTELSSAQRIPVFSFSLAPYPLFSLSQHLIHSPQTSAAFHLPLFFPPFFAASPRLREHFISICLFFSSALATPSSPPRCFPISLWKTESGMRRFIPSLVLCHHDWSLSTTWNQKTPIKPAAACFMCVQRDCLCVCVCVLGSDSGWHCMRERIVTMFRRNQNVYVLRVLSFFPPTATSSVLSNIS